MVRSELSPLQLLVFDADRLSHEKVQNSRKKKNIAASENCRIDGTPPVSEPNGLKRCSALPRGYFKQRHLLRL